MSFTDFHFAEPRWLWLAVVAPFLLAWQHLHAAKKRREQLVRMASPQFVKQLTTSHSPARRRVKEVFLLLACALVALALARPQWGNLEGGNGFVGEDVVFVLDCSQSMTATDVAPNRMQRAKFAVLDFIQKKEHGRVGLVAFAGSAFLQCPLTFDAGAFEETLMGLDEKTIPIPGTDIGKALNEASRAMDKNARRKMVVLITDGEDLEKSGVVAAKQLATNGVVVFAIGVGTPAGKEISTLNTAGQMELLRDAKGEVVRSHLDEMTLREIAQATGGSYFPLGNLGDGLQRVQSAMLTLDVATGLRGSARRGVERFYVPLALVVLLLAVEPLIGTRRKNISAALPILFVLLPSHPAMANETTNPPVPVTAREFYNAGTRLIGSTNFSQAEKLFQTALATQDEQIQPKALFNLGHVRFTEGQAILKKGPDAQKVSAQGKAALAAGERALNLGEAALADKQLKGLVEAYISGRGARRELCAAEKAVKAAMDTFGKTLTKWQRAADDFKGAAELNPADTNAVHNAQLMDERIAKLVDSLREMQQMAGAMAGQKQQLEKMLGKLKGQMPGIDAPPGGKGEGDEEEDGQGNGKGEIKPESLAGKEEGEGREGEEMQAPLSPNQAGQMLDGLPVDGSKRLPMGGDKAGTPPKDKNGRNW